jgi:tetratricopeptide (TPR) repeat protein
MANQTLQFEKAYELYCVAQKTMSQGNYNDAIVILQKSATLNPHYKTLELLGECLVMAGQYCNAIIPLAAATTLNPQPRSTLLLSNAFMSLGEMSKALKMAQLAHDRNPNYGEAEKLIATIQENMDMEELHDC